MTKTHKKLVLILWISVSIVVVLVLIIVFKTIFLSTQNSKQDITSQDSIAPPPAPLEAADNLRSAIENAKNNLMQKLGVGEEMIVLESAQGVDWPDASLGCPEKGKSYSQVITPGYEVILSYQEKNYNYHSDSSGQVSLCQSPQKS